MKRFSSGDQPQRILSALTEAEDFVIDPALQFERSELREFHAYWEQSRGDKNFPQHRNIPFRGSGRNSFLNFIQV